MPGTDEIVLTLSTVATEQVRQLVQAGQAPSIPAFVEHAVSIALEDVAGWASTLDEALAGTGGELTADEQTWANGVLGLNSGTTSRTP